MKRRDSGPKIKPTHALQWVAEPLEGHPTFVQKKMFGFEALCLHNLMMLVLAAKKEPWNGLMLCTFREHHASLMAQFPALAPHEVLGKWLYISQAHPDFEEVALDLAQLALRADPRVGVELSSRSRRRGAPKPPKPRTR